MNSLEQQPDRADPAVPQLYFHAISIHNLNENNMQAIVDLNVSSDQVTKSVPCKIDTGAEGNVLPLGVYKQLYPNSQYNVNGKPSGLIPELLHLVVIKLNIMAFANYT